MSSHTSYLGNLASPCSMSCRAGGFKRLDGPCATLLLVGLWTTWQTCEQSAWEVAACCKSISSPGNLTSSGVWPQSVCIIMGNAPHGGRQADVVNEVELLAKRQVG